MSEEIVKLQNEAEVKHGPGLIGIASATMGRYREFDICKTALKVPKGTEVRWETGCSLGVAHSNLCNAVLNDRRMRWLFLLDDDHVFKSDILINLLDRNVLVVNPFCLKKNSPHHPVIHNMIKEHDGYAHPCLGWDFIQGKSGLIRTPASGNAGRLIRREVIEKMAWDWYRVGWGKDPTVGGCDLYFCKRLQDLGIPLCMDLDNPIGHIQHYAVWPKKNDNNQYSVEIRPATNLPDREKHDIRFLS